jgi:hypothetical protein
MKTLFYCLEMLAKHERSQEQVKEYDARMRSYIPGCSHQSTNHVSTPQNWDYVIMMDGQQSLSYVQAPALEVTRTLSDSPVVANGTGNRISIL